MQQRDPFSWADDYNKQATALGAQGEANAQDAMMRMFVTEAARQQPYSDLPVDLAKQNNYAKNMLGNTMAGYGAKATLEEQKIALKAAPPPNKIAATINQYAKAYGVDADSMTVRAQIESSFNPKAKNPSGASGLWQFMPSTAQQMGLQNPFDVNESTDAAMRYELQNQDYLRKNNIPITAGTTYLAWQQGAGGAVKLLSNPNAPAESIVGRKAVLQNGGRPGMSAQAFANMWINKADRLYKQRTALKARSNPAAGFSYDGVDVNLEDDVNIATNPQEADTTTEDDV